MDDHTVTNYGYPKNITDYSGFLPERPTEAGSAASVTYISYSDLNHEAINHYLQFCTYIPFM